MVTRERGRVMGVLRDSDIFFLFVKMEHPATVKDTATRTTPRGGRRRYHVAFLVHLMRILQSGSHPEKMRSMVSRERGGVVRVYAIPITSFVSSK
jgi:hypothetical protein